MQQLKPVDVVIAGGVFVGLTLPKEITARTSLKVLVLERGQRIAGGAMKKTLIVALAVAWLCAVVAWAQDARTTLDAAAAALGATNLRTIEFSGRGFDFMFGQAYDGSSPWPRFNLASYTMTIDYTIPAMRDDRRRQQAENPPRGGGFQPLVGELRQIWMLNGNYAWDIAGQNAGPAAAERDLRSGVDGRLAQIWLTPHGFIKAAIANHATAKTETVRGAKKTVVSFTASNEAKFEGLLNDQNLVEMITTRFDNPVLGDNAFEAVFRDYKDFGGVKFPARILQRNGGYTVLDVTITDVKQNISAAFDVPSSIRQTTAPQASQTIVPQRLAEGVWDLPGGARTIAVEFRDYIAVVEAPESETRSIAAIDAIKKAIPNKPIRYVINTHSHFDHLGGLRTYAAEGATIITWSGNVPYYENVWANPRTIHPDRLARSGRKPVFEPLVGNRTLSDGSRELVIYHYPNGHNAGMLMVFLPKEKMLIEADSYTPPANLNEPPGGVSFLVQFYDSLERLGLDVDQIVPIHGGRVVPFDEVRRAVETYGKNQLWVK
jgi:glyoxylase-like metal-dependent hydrolase (beta-lactamase superfamily II)